MSHATKVSGQLPTYACGHPATHARVGVTAHSGAADRWRARYPRTCGCGPIQVGELV